MVMHHYELPKLPEGINAGDGLLLWLKLFAAETEEELEQIKRLGVAELEQAISMYRGITASEEYRNLERLRDRTIHNEASALANARNKGEASADARWKGVVAEKDAKLQRQRAELQSKDAEIARLRMLLEGITLVEL